LRPIQHGQAFVPANQMVARAEGGVDQVLAIGIRQAPDPVHAGKHIVPHADQRLACIVLANLVQHQHQGASHQEQAEQAQQLLADAESGWVESHLH
jgi:hypothetical protein